MEAPLYTRSTGPLNLECIRKLSIPCRPRNSFGSSSQQSAPGLNAKLSSLSPLHTFKIFSKGRSSRGSRPLLNAEPSQARDFGGPDALLFDCDGVLVDTEAEGHRIAFNKAFKEKGAICAEFTASQGPYASS